ncbi:MAG: hydroxyethylthiazole kinase [Halanaerobium sp.]
MSVENNNLSAEIDQKWKQIKDIIKKEKPLIHHITNNVTVNDCANITLNLGALPVMAPGAEESAQMVENASALVLNLGTISSSQLDSMLKAGRRANQLGIPVILDPVGVGSTEFRNKAAHKLITELELTVIKGNQGEISFLAGQKAEVKGVEAIGNYSQIELTAENLAAKLNTIVVVSSKIDIISDGKITKKINRGSPLMAEVVGTGCMLGSTLAVFTAAAGSSNFKLIELLETAVYHYALAAEKAAAKEQTPAKFKREFMDNIYLKMN